MYDVVPQCNIFAPTLIASINIIENIETVSFRVIADKLGTSQPAIEQDKTGGALE